MPERGKATFVSNPRCARRARRSQAALLADSAAAAHPRAVRSTRPSCCQRRRPGFGSSDRTSFGSRPKLRLRSASWASAGSSRHARARKPLVLAESRSFGRRAAARIKPVISVKPDIALELRGRAASLRLARRRQARPWFLDHFRDSRTSGVTALDVGASTGGFTDAPCASARRGAIYAVDVGHGQLAWKLRSDPRVIVLGAHQRRYLTGETGCRSRSISLVCDASFIGLEIVLPGSTRFWGAGAPISSR